MPFDQPMRLDLTELGPRCPDFRVAALVATGLTIPAERPAALDAEIAAREAACRAAHPGVELGAIPGVAAWRVAYKGFGIKRTSYRSSVERLVKNVLAERRLAFVNGFVDAYNAVSLAHVMPAGADDLDRLTGDVCFRYARPGDSFLDMAGGGGAEEGDGAATAGGPTEDPPKDGEVVLADAAHVLCRRWNWRQDLRSLITPATTAALLTIQSNGVGDVAAAADDAVRLIIATCGGRVDVHLLDAGRPTVTLF
jgi:DNA/RNA-binding domain of Phe-tRNA-synthetase-like protein